MTAPDSKKGTRFPVHISYDGYTLDNRDDHVTEIHIDVGDKYLIVEVCPQELLRNAYENLPVPEDSRAEYIEMFNDLDATITEEVDDWIESH